MFGYGSDHYVRQGKFMITIIVIDRCYSAAVLRSPLSRLTATLYTRGGGGCLDSVQTTAFVRGLQYQRCCSGSNRGWFIVVVAIADLFACLLLIFFIIIMMMIIFQRSYSH